MSGPGANISTIFQSIQGEGVYIGQRQIFVRFAGCNLSCAYCDTQTSRSSSAQDLEKICVCKKKNEVKRLENPISITEAAEAVNSFISAGNPFHSVSLTGGEPLLQVDFLTALLPQIKLPKYLETNGTLPDRLYEIIDLVDIIAMDYKLPSATKCGDYAAEHGKFLDIAMNKEVFVKAVFSKDTSVQEIDDMSRLIAGKDDGICLVLQPAAAGRTFKSAPSPEQCLSYHSVAKRSLKNVLVIPQAHKLIGLD
ncbi:MAG: 7-carboxy-7-deazaguanine synthase QueE [Candidatus Margulisiibacteriota bacterium]